MRVKVQGFKLRNYDATYEQCDFLFEERLVNNEQRNIKIVDLQSGQEIWIPVPLKVETPSHKTKRN